MQGLHVLNHMQQTTCDDNQDVMTTRNKKWLSILSFFWNWISTTVISGHWIWLAKLHSLTLYCLSRRLSTQNQSIRLVVEIFEVPLWWKSSFLMLLMCLCGQHHCWVFLFLKLQ